MHTRPTLLTLAVVAALALAACTHGPADYQSMNGWGGMMGMSGFGGGFMWLLWILIAAAVFYAVVTLGRRSRTTVDPAQESALDILNKRYAKGEITKEEFEERKRDIEN
jgi:putative membrane protein